MADAAVVGALTEALLGKALLLLAEEISLSLGIKKELKKLAGKLELIHALLSDAQTKQLPGQAVEAWLKKLKHVAIDARIVLDDYGYKVLRQKIQCRKRDKVLSFFSSSNPVVFYPKMGHKIRDVLSSLGNVYAEAKQIGLNPVELISSLPECNKGNRLTFPFVEESEIVGRDDDVLEVVRMLTDPQQEKDLSVISIIGMGGQGKTTLAQVVYKDEKVESYFEKKVWICVSDDFDVARLLAQMLESLTSKPCQLTTPEALVNELKEQLSGKTCLFIFDNVWDISTKQWDEMRNCLLEIRGSNRSKVLATTRSEDVAYAMRTSGYHRLQILSDDQSVALFERFASSEGGSMKTPALVAIGERILKRCGGVPLAIRVVAGLLHSKHSESEWSAIESKLWSIKGDNVLSVIKLSYDSLSPPVKQCFAYCAVFPKDTELDKNMLVQLWMAQGFLNPKDPRLLMEDLGNEYFNVLLKNSLLHDAGEYGYDEVVCKMHDLVHDLALVVSETCHVDMRNVMVGSDMINAFNLSATNCGEERLKKSVESAFSSKLRSLNLKGSLHSSTFQQLHDWFENFRCLTSLTISVPSLKILPEEIGKIKHLRFLNIRNTSVCTLPKSFKELYYMETLLYDGLSRLPVGFSNLINLRHLCESPIYKSSNLLIPRLSHFTNIQTVPHFRVDKSEGCGIEELEYLDNLRGALKIYGLDNVSSYESALRSKLSNKSRIHTLVLRWDEREHVCDDTKVMEGLNPHSNLKRLKIDGYQSLHFPFWMALLRSLIKVTLKNLDKCEQLPSLGDLQCLEVLHITGLRNLKCIGKEFYGLSDARNGSSSNGAEMTLFPALKEFRLRSMEILEEFSDVFIPTHSIVKAFPSLEILSINSLPNLSVFPNLGSLPRLRTLFIDGCPNLAIPPNWNMPTLANSSAHLDAYNNAELHYLQYLCIVDCDKLMAPLCSLKNLTALKDLNISGNVNFWPKDLHNLINLKSLNLRSSNLSEEIDSFPFPYSVSTATECSLTSLVLHGWSEVTALPDQIQYLTSLRSLYIHDFGLEVFPEWVCNLKCLELLEIWNCEKLKQFPSTEALKRLSNLKSLEVYGCPLLKERCAKEDGPEWHKIAHIPNITFEEC